MNSVSRFLLIPALLLPWAVFNSTSADDSMPDAAPGMSLTLDELYASPSLTGTRPRGIAWSADSSEVAYLWNAQGHPGRDIWVYSVTDRKSRRLTWLADEADVAGNGVTEVAWLHGDHARLAYVLDEAIHILDAAGGDKVVARDQGIRAINGSPDGRKLVYISRSGIWTLEHSDGSWASPRQVLAVEDKQQVTEYQWISGRNAIAFSLTDNRPLPEREIHYYSGDGLQVDRVSRAFPGQQTAHYRLGTVDLASGSIRYFERPDERHYTWNWAVSGDGSQLFVNSSDLLVKHHRIYLYDIASGKRVEFYHEHDARHLRPDWRAAWAPGNEGLVILTDRDGYLHLYHQQSRQSAPRQLTSGDWEISAFWIDRQRAQVYFLANRSGHGNRLLYRVPFGGGKVERISSETNGMHAPVFSPDMRYAASIYSNDNKPHDLHLLDLQAGSSEQLTRSPGRVFYEQRWADVRYIEFPSHIDGTTLVGRLSLPPGFDPDRPYPLIVGSVYSDSVLNQWGGRQSHPTWGLDQYLVAQGYILLNVNIRGSWGQGRKHNQGLRHGYGIVDIEDLHSGVKHLVSAGFADPDRVGIWGSSYGGLMTMMSLFKKPGVYAAGIAGAPATNVAHAYPGQMWV
ncbi:MAG: DPP IV N-terminal domain-containing protein, partial [Gammaproteobacteria bacterium]|nr:DPP IV N-terminal domain-containing protein [Gammaproteobacteria bacterium]